MEGLSLRETHLFRQRTSPTTQPTRSPRLPTPEASRSSHDAFDNCTYATDARKAMPLRDLLQQPPKSLTSPNSPVYHSARLEPRHHQSAPHSPPYRDNDAQKPSLPPLKTVLYDSLSSPPQTPTTFSGPFQPSPCEPAYTAATYKPPSLYPNKKQRIGPVPDSVTSHHTSPLFADNQTTRPQSDAPRRFSVQYPASDNYDRRQSRVSQGGLLGPSVPQSSTLEPTVRSGATRSYGTLDATPIMTAFDRELPRLGSQHGSKHSREIRDVHHTEEHHSEQYPLRRASLVDPYRRFDVTHDAHRARPLAHHRPNRLSQDPCNGTPMYESRAYRPNTEYEMRQQPPTLHYSVHDASRPSFFMPSQCEYQHGKARKRSNLPKQSTEIMKTWFDQNIGNPYPSEEQKAIFSQATGISMTQVSNWFINHRRRCPELRDRRERHGGHSREVETV